jgi:subtilase family serine protease
MKLHRVVAVLVALFLIVGVVGGSPARASAHVMSTMLAKGPRAIPAKVASPADYGLFTCQVGLATDGVTCYDPYQMRTAYGFDKLIAAGYDGKGKTIVILDAFQHPNIEGQLAAFNDFYGLPQFNQPGGPAFMIVAPEGLTPFDPTDANMLGWAEEISLDVEWAHAIAPGANIVLELAKDNSDEALGRALSDIVKNRRGDAISMSFGEADSCVTPQVNMVWHQAFVTATRKGMSLFASSGDAGAAQPTCDGSSYIKAASSPAVDPLVTGVGGTELHAAGYCIPVLGCDPSKAPAPGTYIDEIGWNEGPYGSFPAYFPTTLASGGGYSSVWKTPPYQKPVVRNKMRGVPDVAYNAAVLHGVMTYIDIPGVPGLDGAWYLFGGTSAGAPQWAALAVIADQAAHRNYGFINTALYRMQPIGGEQGDCQKADCGGRRVRAFHDITAGNNSAIEVGAGGSPVDIKGYNAVRGWDAVTGLGSPNVPTLIKNLRTTWSAWQGAVVILQSRWQSGGRPGAHHEMDTH